MYTHSELLAESGADEEVLNRLEKEKLLVPAGTTSDGLPLYTRSAHEQLKKITTLLALGYRWEDVVKIIKKVGFPGDDGRRRRSAREDQFLTVGGLAERVGISPRTIKHWEDKGIIEADMRSEGGFRLYSETFVFLCELIRDLQLFGYSLEDIKAVSDLFRDFLTIQSPEGNFPEEQAGPRLDEMLGQIRVLYQKMDLLKAGIERWDDLLKKKKKEITALRNRSRKRRSAKGKDSK